MPREPGLDAAVLAHQVDELAALLLIRVIQPAAAVDDVVLLQHAQARTIGRSMREDEDLPAIFRGVIDQNLLEPLHLLCCFEIMASRVKTLASRSHKYMKEGWEQTIVDGDLVRSILRGPKHGRAHSNQERLVSDLAHELRARLVVFPARPAGRQAHVPRRKTVLNWAVVSSRN